MKCKEIETKNLHSISITQNVIVHPTHDEISRATHIIRYGNITNPQNSTCPISLQGFVDDTEVMRIRFCGHLFIPEQLEMWFRENVRCPLCRYDIRNYLGSASQSNRSENIDNNEDITENNDYNHDASNNITSTNVSGNNDGTMVFSRSLVSTNVNELQNQLQSFIEDINRSIANNPVINTRSIVPLQIDGFQDSNLDISNSLLDVSHNDISNNNL